MATVNVPFLINPPKRLGKKRLKKGARKAKRVSHNPWSGQKVRHRVAKKYGYAGTPYTSYGGARHWKSASKSTKKRIMAIRRRKHKNNPLGEAIMLVGANPKGGSMARKKRKSSKKRYSHNPVRRKRSKRHRSNPVAKRHGRKRHRRNPADGSIQVTKPMSYLPQIAAGTVGAIATTAAPRLLNLTSPLAVYGVQAVTAVAGSVIANKIVGKKYGTAFLIGGGVAILGDVVNRFIFKKTGLSGLLGLGENTTYILPSGDMGYMESGVNGFAEVDGDTEEIVEETY